MMKGCLSDSVFDADSLEKQIFLENTDTVVLSIKCSNILSIKQHKH